MKKLLIGLLFVILLSFSTSSVYAAYPTLSDIGKAVKLNYPQYQKYSDEQVGKAYVKMMEYYEYNFYRYTAYCYWTRGC